MIHARDGRRERRRTDVDAARREGIENFSLCSNLVLELEVKVGCYRIEQSYRCSFPGL